MSKHKTLTAMPTKKLKEILAHHHTQGVDGADYEPVREELEIELWERQNAETERLIKQHEQAQKEHFKYMAQSHKRSK